MALDKELEEAKDKIARIEFESQKLLDAAAVVLKSEDFPTAARAVFDIAKELTGASSGYVALLSEDGSENEVLFLDAGGFPCTVDANLPMPIRGLREVAYRQNKPAYNNTFMSSEWVGFMPQGHVVMDNVLFGPLVISGRAEGIIGLANKPSDFTEDDVRLVMALANLVAIGLNRTKIEAELRESQVKLSESIGELQLYASLLHHDLSNDLQLIIGEIELAQLNATKDPRRERYLSSIESASSRMLRLLQVFQESDIVDEGNLKDIILHLVNETKSSYPHIVIQSHIVPTEDKVSIKGKSLIPFVFDNLIRNAVQHVGPNVEIDIHMAAREEKVILDFVDNGHGIDKDQIENLFQKGVSKTGGGFGLYLCKKIIEVYEGTINLLSNDVYNKGSAIRIELPRIKKEKKPRGHTGY
ncbi:MAG: GAF domain-containing sensor histidine kinase [Candidatus Thorarchaeota archaeon]